MKMNLHPTARFSVGPRAFDAVYTHLKGLLNGMAAAGPTTLSYSSAGMQALWESHDPASWMENIALSITNHLRLTPALTDANRQPLNSAHDDFYKGTVYASEAFVVVRWGWLAYP